MKQQGQFSKLLFYIILSQSGSEQTSYPPGYSLKSNLALAATTRSLPRIMDLLALRYRVPVSRSVEQRTDVNFDVNSTVPLISRTSRGTAATLKRNIIGTSDLRQKIYINSNPPLLKRDLPPINSQAIPPFTSLLVNKMTSEKSNIQIDNGKITFLDDEVPEIRKHGTSHDSEDVASSLRGSFPKPPVTSQLSAEKDENKDKIIFPGTNMQNPKGNVTIPSDLNDRVAFDGDECPTGYVKINGKCVRTD
ncbi:hypothetical protein evm_011533 [Chilo suppressalis]|nr:hypothetical protein evm_011533 [Chilo suppressalis]